MQIIDYDRCGINLDTSLRRWLFGFYWDGMGGGMDILFGPILIELYWGEI